MELIPLSFLREASPRSLEDLELSALNRSANFSKALRTEIEAFVEQAAIALLARWMLEHRGELGTSQAEPTRVDLFEIRRKEKSA